MEFSRELFSEGVFLPGLHFRRSPEARRAADHHDRDAYTDPDGEGAGSAEKVANTDGDHSVDPMENLAADFAVIADWKLERESI